MLPEFELLFLNNSANTTGGLTKYPSIRQWTRVRVRVACQMIVFVVELLTDRSLCQLKNFQNIINQREKTSEESESRVLKYLLSTFIFFLSIQATYLLIENEIKRHFGFFFYFNFIWSYFLNLIIFNSRVSEYLHIFMQVVLSLAFTKEIMFDSKISLLWRK